MNRHNAFLNGEKRYSSREHGNLSISPHRFQPRSHPAQRRRRQLLIRLAIAGSASVFLLLLFFPSLRSTFIGTLSLGLLAGGPPELQLETVRYYDLSNSGGTERGWEREERILMCAPLRDAETHLPMFFAHLHNFTYPHHLIDLAFLVSDSKDNTLNLLSQMLTDLQNHPDPRMPYGEISVIEKDFGQKVNQDVESRHGFAAQASRRKLMAQARNWLLSAALRPTHSWVYWRDADVETAPFTILEDLMRHNKDVIVPNIWRPLPDWLGGEQPYDLNSWQESETALALADTLDEDAVIVEGYAEYATWRPHLAYLRDPYGDPDMEMEIDGVGGVSILAKAKVFRAGVHFPAFSFEKHAETEGFGKMAKRMQFTVVGLPHYTVWHLYEPSVDDIRHMEEMEQERKNRENEERERTERMKKIKEEFNDPSTDWEKDKTEINDLSQKEDQIRKEHDAAMADKEKEKEKPLKDDSTKESTAKDEKKKDSATKDISDKEATGKEEKKEKEKPIDKEKASKDDTKEKILKDDTKDSMRKTTTSKDDVDESEAKGDIKDTTKKTTSSKDGLDDSDSKADTKDTTKKSTTSKDSLVDSDSKDIKTSKDSKITKDSKKGADSDSTEDALEKKSSKDKSSKLDIDVEDIAGVRSTKEKEKLDSSVKDVKDVKGDSGSKGSSKEKKETSDEKDT